MNLARPARAGADPTGTNTGRNESEAQRIDRNLSELFEELRVAIIGVQVLFGFLLSLPFTALFAQLDDWQRGLYTGDLLLSALATALLVAPVAYHRLVFRRHAKRGLLFRANVMAIAGLVCVGVAISGSVLLVMSVVYSGVLVAILAAATALVIFTLWFVVPKAAARPEEY